MRISDWSSDVCSSDLGELKKDFADRDAVLIGASTDTDFVHFAWRKSDERLANCDFPWIADNKKELAEALGIAAKDARSEERRVGKERVSTCRSRWSPYH